MQTDISDWVPSLRVLIVTENVSREVVQIHVVVLDELMKQSRMHALLDLGRGATLLKAIDH